MSNTDFFPELSTDAINVGSDFTECLTDTLEEMQADIEGKAETNHTHTDYATSNHTHDGFADKTHGHTYADVTCPPMLFGVEYLTNEMWNGEPLYTTLINCGNFTRNSAVQTDIICSRIVRYNGRIGDHCLPFVHSTFDNAYTCWVTVANNNGHIKIAMYGGANVGSVATEVQIWYTKPTT